MKLEELVEKLKKKEKIIRERAEELGVKIGKDFSDEKTAFKPDKRIYEPELTEKEFSMIRKEIKNILDSYTAEYIADHLDEVQKIYDALMDIYASSTEYEIIKDIEEFKTLFDAVSQEKSVVALRKLLSDAEEVLNSLESLQPISAKKMYSDLLKREQLLSSTDHPLRLTVRQRLDDIGRTLQNMERDSEKTPGKPGRGPAPVPTEWREVEAERENVFSRFLRAFSTAFFNKIPITPRVKYVGGRLLMLPPIILSVSLIVFTLVYLCPGDAVDRAMGLEQVVGDSMRMDEYLRMKEMFGLDQPWHIQYLYWLRHAITGNLGFSFSTGRPVVQEILRRIPDTLSYQILGLLLSVTIAVPAGVISALRQNTKTDTYIVMGSLLGASFPPFVIGLALILLFTLYLGWFPGGGTHSWEFMGRSVPHDLSYYFDYLKHLLLPTVTLALATAGYTTRLVRSAMLNVLTEDYILTARSKGLKERTVIYKHALKNAMLPVITVIGLRMAMVLSGAPVIEYMFSWPGLGKFFVDAVWMRDYFAVIGGALALGMFILLANLFVDLSYKWLDPRVEL